MLQGGPGDTRHGPWVMYSQSPKYSPCQGSEMKELVPASDDSVPTDISGTGGKRYFLHIPISGLTFPDFPFAQRQLPSLSLCDHGKVSARWLSVLTMAPGVAVVLGPASALTVAGGIPAQPQVQCPPHTPHSDDRTPI